MASQRDLIAWMRWTRGRPVGGEAADVGLPARHPDLEMVLAELAEVGVEQRFEFVWADDSSGVDPDDPHVIHIHRSLTRAADVPGEVHAAAERAVSLDIASVARHEIGHALLFRRPGDARTAEFRRLFGDVEVAYRVGNPIDEIERRMRRHGGLSNPRYRRVVSLYAATHPHERFAEAVRIALRLRAHPPSLDDWAERHGVAAIVVAQLRFAARWLRAYDR